MDTIWLRIERWLNQNAKAVAEGLNPPAIEQELKETERLIGIRFPDDVRATYLRHDGQDAQSPWMIDAWQWMALKEIRESWSLWKDLLDRGAFKGLLSEPDDKKVRNDWWSPGWIPITFSGSGDHHCLDMAPGPRGNVGQVIEMYHDDVIRPLVSPNFRAWLNEFATELESGVYIQSEEYGALVRADSI